LNNLIEKSGITIILDKNEGSKTSLGLINVSRNLIRSKDVGLVPSNSRSNKKLQLLVN
jgi:hypothetical protein